MIKFDPELRKTLARGTKSDVLNRAFRLRAGFIGAAQSCLCAWPVVKASTSTEHNERCPAHHIIQSAVAAEEQR